MRQAHDITISGTAEPRKVRAEILKDGSIRGRSAWVKLEAGQSRLVQITLDAPAGDYQIRQATNTGSNIHESLTYIDLGTIQHG